MDSYTAIVKKCGRHYVALCLELNVASQGETLYEAKAQLEDAIEEYLAYMRESGGLDDISPVSIEDLREFLFEGSNTVSLSTSQRAPIRFPKSQKIGIDPRSKGFPGFDSLQGL